MKFHGIPADEKRKSRASCADGRRFTSLEWADNRRIFYNRYDVPEGEEANGLENTKNEFQKVSGSWYRLAVWWVRRAAAKDSGSGRRIRSRLGAAVYYT